MRKLDELAFTGILGNLAEVNRKLGHYNSAFNIGSEALALAKKMKKRKAIAMVSLTLAYTEYARHHYQSAIVFAQQALDFFERSGLYYKEIDEVKSLIKDCRQH